MSVDMNMSEPCLILPINMPTYRLLNWHSSAADLFHQGHRSVIRKMGFHSNIQNMPGQISSYQFQH